MERRALLTVAVALGAAAAFAVGVAAFDDVVSGTDSTVDGDDGPTKNGSGGGTRDTRATRGSGSAAGGCLVCRLSARSLVGSLLPAVSPLLLVGLAAAVVAGAALLGLRPGRDRTPPADESDDGAARSGDAGRRATAGPPDAAGLARRSRPAVTVGAGSLGAAVVLCGVAGAGGRRSSPPPRRPSSRGRPARRASNWPTTGSPPGRRGSS